jgi:hypothetical protein
LLGPSLGGPVRRGFFGADLLVCQLERATADGLPRRRCGAGAPETVVDYHHGGQDEATVLLVG